ncbi:MAG TPA: T9SS C-terminal target domain-containing protein [Verrucomicrobiota bacterium]|nr:T9SS C-terminal target domain-containing protein [Verrucomicrobiota bacterium]
MKNRIKSCLVRLAIVAGLAGAFTAQALDVQVAANITGNVTWYATNEYYLNGQIYVLSNAVLTIEPGTVVRGVAGDTNTYAALFVTRDGKLFAEGTRTRPIIFTAEVDDLNDPEDLTSADRGLWGGIVLMGKSTINTAIDLAGNAASPKYDLYEGLSDITINGQQVHRFGGNDDADSSGVIRYVSIRHGGTKIKQDKEINGLSLCAVGSGTTIEFVEVFAIADDGFEWFGGTVNTKYLVSSFCDDEQFDVDESYRGKGQFWFGMSVPGINEFGGEWNGEPNTFAVSNAPIGKFEVYNMTLIGGGTSGRALRIRDYAAPQVYNSIWTEFPTQGVRVDEPGVIFFTNGMIHFQETLWHNVGQSSAVFSNYVFGVSALSNVFANPLLTGVSWTPNGVLDPRPQAGSPALGSSVTAPNNGHYKPVTYKGAFGGSLNWAVQWTVLGEMNHISSKGGTEPVPQPMTTPATPTAPTMTIADLGNGTVDISWTTETGFSYQLQSKLTIDAGWGDVGTPVPGTGSPVTVNQPMDGERYFQVLIQ